MEWHKGHNGTRKAATRRFQALERRTREAGPDGHQSSAHVPILVCQTPRSLSRGINPHSSLFLSPHTHPQTNKNAKSSIYFITLKKLSSSLSNNTLNVPQKLLLSDKNNAHDDHKRRNANPQMNSLVVQPLPSDPLLRRRG